MDTKAFLDYLASAETAKTFDPKVGRKLAPAPFAADDLAVIVAVKPLDKWPDAARRIAKLGGDRLDVIDREVETFLKTADGSLLKATPSTIANAFADMEIDNPGGEPLTIRRMAVKKLKAWENEFSPARAIIAKAIADIKAALPKAGYSEADLSAGRDAAGVFGGLGIVAEKKSAA